jgi:hypothetical protein
MWGSVYPIFVSLEAVAAGVVQDYLLRYHVGICITYISEFRGCGGWCSLGLPSGISYGDLYNLYL